MKHFHCPVNGWDCPYYKNKECGLEDPHADCDDFASMWDKDDDYLCEDEERTFFEKDIDNILQI